MHQLSGKRHEAGRTVTGLWLAGILAACLVPVPDAIGQGPLSAPDGEPSTAGWRPGAPVELSAISSGELLWRSEAGLIPLPVLDIRVELAVTGILLEGRVTQQFSNPTSETIEVQYVFPMPEGAAVHRMEMRIGERRIRSVVRERLEAKRTYERARDSGRKAALLDQQRPDLFTTRAANINPGESVAVVVEYLEEIRYRDGEFSLRFPLTFIPRFAATRPERAQRVEGSARRGTPRARIEARIRPGMPLVGVASESHLVEIERLGDDYRVRTGPEPVAADRDFILRWRPALADRPSAAVFTEEFEDRRYAMMMLMPPIPGSEAGLGLATETLFLIDVSGSMSGSSIDQARQALLAALDRLRPEDRFNILRFNDENEAFRESFQHAEGEALDAARSWVGRLSTGGGTMIHPALMRGLRMMGEAPPGPAQRIVFLTDGAISDEQEIFRSIRDHLGAARLHTIGIGHAPNTHLMRKMARLGRGMCDFVGDADQAGNRIAAFFSRLDRPVMTDLELSWEGVELDELSADRPHDLHAGEPLVLYARLAGGTTRGLVRLGGQTRAGWIDASAEIDAGSGSGGGIARRWARTKVESLLDRGHEAGDTGLVRDEVIDLGLAFHLVTPFTSLVAVEEVPTATGPARSRRMAGVLPAGGTGAPLRGRIGLLLAVSGLAWLLAGRLTRPGS